MTFAIAIQSKYIFVFHQYHPKYICTLYIYSVESSCERAHLPASWRLPGHDLEKKVKKGEPVRSP